MKRRLGFVANSSSSDFILGNNDDFDEETDEEIELREREERQEEYDDGIMFGKKECQHFFVSRTGFFSTNRKIKHHKPAVCIICGAFVDAEIFPNEFQRQDLTQSVNGDEFSFFENPFAKRKFKNGFDFNNKLKDNIIL